MSRESVRFGSKADLVADTLRSEIQRGTLAPGDLLKQRDLAQRFGVSPTPVREALSTLRAEGFVVAELHHGASVVRPTLDRLWENALIRGELEVLACRLATGRAKQQDIDELNVINESFAAAEPGSPEANAANRELHFRIYELADAPVLLGIMTQLWRAIDRAPNTFRDRAESVAQHAALIDAIGRGDAADAAEIAEVHVGEASDRMRHEMNRLSGKEAEGA